MSTDTELKLWWTEEARSMFVYYLTGSLAIAFAATVMVTKSLQRQEPQVVELFCEDLRTELLMSYIISVSTDVFFGSSCQKSTKVFMQIQGQMGSSQIFHLPVNIAGKERLQRGCTDLFLFKVPVSIGRITGVRFIVSGLIVPLTWKISSVELYDPSTGAKREVQVSVTTPELMDSSSTRGVLRTPGTFKRQLRNQCLYHQWLAMGFNTQRFGAFTEIAHVLSVFMSLLMLLLVSLLTYLLLPRATIIIDNAEEEGDNMLFNLNAGSFFLGSVIASSSCFVLILILELTLRSIRSLERKPGKAYYTVRNDSKIVRGMLRYFKFPSKELVNKLDNPEVYTLFLKEDLLNDNPNIVQVFNKKSVGCSKSGTRAYTRYIKKFIDYLRSGMSEEMLIVGGVDIPMEESQGNDAESSDQCSLLSEDLSNVDLADSSLKDGDTKSMVIGCVQCRKPAGGKDRDWYQQWQRVQKNWARQIVRFLHTAVSEIRHALEDGTLKYKDVTDNLQRLCQAIVCRIAMTSAAQEHFSGDFSKDICSLTYHLAVETLVLCFNKIYTSLQAVDTVTLADLMLQSHALMLAVEHAADTVVFFDKECRQMKGLSSCLELAEDCHTLHFVFLRNCFKLLNSHALVSWSELKVLSLEQAPDFPVKTHERLVNLTSRYSKKESLETLAVKRLCRSVQREALEEVWFDLHSNRNVLTRILLKQHVLQAFGVEIIRETRLKLKFDDKHDLLPLEPKSRIQLMMEKRKQGKMETEKSKDSSGGRHVSFQKDIEAGTDLAASSETDRKKMLKYSEDWESYIDLLQFIHDRLKKKWVNEGVKIDLNAGQYLARAILHPCVVVVDTELESGHKGGIHNGKIKFDNFLHLKRGEHMVTQFLEATTEDFVEHLMTTILAEFDLRNMKMDDPAVSDCLNDIYIKVDTLMQVLKDDLESIMIEAVRIEPTVDRFSRELVKKSFPNLMRKASSVVKWGTPHIHDILDVEAVNIELVKEEDQAVQNDPVSEPFVIHLKPRTSSLSKGKEKKIMKYAAMTVLFLKNRDQNNSNQQSSLDSTSEKPGVAFKQQTESWSFTDLIDDMISIKRIVQSGINAVSLSDRSTQRRHIKRSREKIDHCVTVHRHNVVDFYYMIEEGDDSQVLTKSGLYQLEHDCMGESRKPVPVCVKSLLLFVMKLIIVLSMLYVTLVGGQLTTVQLQEWVCYYLASVALFGLVLEPIRAAIVGWFVG